MAEIYARLIRRGLKTIEVVPTGLRQKVLALLAEDGSEDDV